MWYVNILDSNWWKLIKCSVGLLIDVLFKRVGLADRFGGPTIYKEYFVNCWTTKSIHIIIVIKYGFKKELHFEVRVSSLLLHETKFLSEKDASLALYGLLYYKVALYSAAFSNSVYSTHHV